MTCSSAIIPSTSSLSFNFSIQTNHNELLNINNTVGKVKDNNTNSLNTSTTAVNTFISQSIKSSNKSLIIDQFKDNGATTTTVVDSLIDTIEAKNLATTETEFDKASNFSSTIHKLSNSIMNNGLSNGHDHRINVDIIIDPTTTADLTSSSSSTTCHSSITTTTSTTTTMGILNSPDNSNLILFSTRRDGSTDFKILENGDVVNDMTTTTTTMSTRKDWTNTMMATAAVVDELSSTNDENRNGPKLSDEILPQITTTTSSSLTNHEKMTNQSNALKTDQINVENLTTTTSTTTTTTTTATTNNHHHSHMIECKNNNDGENNSLVKNSCDSNKQCSSSSSSISNQQQQSLCFPDTILDDEIMSMDDDDHHHQSIHKCDDEIETLGGPTLNSFLPSPPPSSQSIFDNDNNNVSNSHLVTNNAQNKQQQQEQECEKQQKTNICNDLLNKQQTMQKFSAEIKHRIRRLQLQYTHKNLSKQMKLFVAENQRLNSVQCQRFELDFSNFINNLDYNNSVLTSSDSHHHHLNHLNHNHHHLNHQSPFIFSPNKLKTTDQQSSIKQSDLKLACSQNQSDSSQYNNGKQAKQSDIANNDNHNLQLQQSNKSKSNSQTKSSMKLMKENREKLLTTIDSWRCNLRHLECKYDSDATDSSSGGESCDESESFEDIAIDNNKSMNGASSTYTTLQSSISSVIWPTTTNNHNQQSKHRISMRNSLNWKWCNERSQIASQWSWLQAHILDLQTKLRQQTDLFRHIRSTKGTINFGENEVIQRQLPLSSIPSAMMVVQQQTKQQQQQESQNEKLDENKTSTTEVQDSQTTTEQCMRTMPFISMKRRKLIWSEPNLSVVSTKKAVKYSSIQCSCNIFPSHVAACVICNGRYSYMNNIDTELMPYHERVSLLDPCCHPTLSIPNDVPLGLYFANYLKREIFDINNKSASTTRSKKKKTTSNDQQLKLDKSAKKLQSLNSSLLTTTIKSNRKNQMKMNKNKKRRRLSSDSFKKSHQRDRLSSGCSSRAESPVPSPSASDISVGSVSTPTNTSYQSSITPMNRRRRSEQHAFDINNIVIPYSIAATTRVERLQYKEIVTPKWRLIEDCASSSEKPKEEEIDENKIDADSEDVSDAAFQIRHLKCEQTERQRILNYYGKNNQKNQSKIRNKGPQRVRFESSSKSDSLDQNSQDSFHNNNNTNSKYKSKSSSMISNYDNYYADNSSSSRKRQNTLSKNTSRDEYSSLEMFQEQQEIVSPYEPRKFPLSDCVYEKMVEETNNQQKEMEEQQLQQQRSSRSSAKINVEYDDSMDADDDEDEDDIDDKHSPPTIDDDEEDADEEIDEDELNNDDDEDDEDDGEDDNDIDDDDDNDIDVDIDDVDHDDDDIDDDEDDDELIVHRTPSKISHCKRGGGGGRHGKIHHQSNDLLTNEDDPEWKPPPTKLS